MSRWVPRPGSEAGRITLPRKRSGGKVLLGPAGLIDGSALGPWARLRWGAHISGQRQWRARAESPCVARVRTAAAAAEGPLPTNSASLEGCPVGLLWGMKTSSGRQRRTAGIRSVSRPSPGREAMGETRPTGRSSIAMISTGFDPERTLASRLLLPKPGRLGDWVVMAAEIRCISIFLNLCGIHHGRGGRRPRNVNFPEGLSRETYASAERPRPRC